jgi:hypothetical protein
MRVRLYRLFLIFLVIIPFLGLAGISLQPTPSPIPPTTITLSKQNATLGEVAASLSTSSGIPITLKPALGKEKCPVAFTSAPFWGALEKVAQQTGTRIVLADQATKVVLEPRGMSREVSTVSGPFRIVAKQVIGRALLDIGSTFHEVYLEVNWEPRIAVFRIDAQPTITKAIDDRNRVLTVPTSITNNHPVEALTDMKFRVNGLTRESKQISVLAGEFRVTAAEKMLAFEFKGLDGELPASKTDKQITVSLKEMAKPDKTWDVKLELNYPSDHPAFESFEAQKWLRDNRLFLIPPGGGKPIESESEEIDVHGRRVDAIYRFPGNINPRAKNWSLIYKTPSPLVEFKVPFELKDIPIP